VMHRLAAHELAQRRPQHRTAIRGARVRRLAGALELELPGVAARFVTSPSVIARPSPSWPAQVPN